MQIAPDSQLTHLIRIGREMFDKLVFILSKNPIFQSTNPSKPQRHVKFQLATFLLCYGHRGSDAFQVMHKLGIGQGSVYNYCRRVVRAIRELRDEYVGWPSEERKEEIKRAIFERSGFRECLGSGDGTHIQLTARPTKNPVEYMNRKKDLSVRHAHCLIFTRLFNSDMCRQICKLQ
jgi:hypothetical protein